MFRNKPYLIPKIESTKSTVRLHIAVTLNDGIYVINLHIMQSYLQSFTMVASNRKIVTVPASYRETQGTCELPRNYLGVTENQFSPW